ncbi:hypothetical protein IAU60_001058 [Kwoniella sp. DSM 27419]
MFLYFLTLLPALSSISAQPSPLDRGLSTRQAHDNIRVTVTAPDKVQLVAKNADGTPDWNRVTSHGASPLSFDWSAGLLRSTPAGDNLADHFFFIELDGSANPPLYLNCDITVPSEYRGWITFDGQPSGEFVVGGNPVPFPEDRLKVVCVPPGYDQ